MAGIPVANLRGCGAELGTGGPLPAQQQLFQNSFAALTSLQATVNATEFIPHK